MLSRSLPAKLSTSYFHVSSPSSMLYRFSQRSFRKLFAQFPLRPACCLAPSRGSSPQALQHAVSLPPSAALRKLLYVFVCLPAKLSARYLHGFLSVQHAVLAPSQRSSPQAISTISSPSSMLYPFSQRSSRKLFALFRLRPACCLGPSRRSSPQALFARFPLRPACCLAPSYRSSPQAICMVSSSSSMLSRSLPAKLSANYFHGFLSVQHAVSLPLNEAFPKLFPLYPILPACCLAPSQRSSPQAISTVSSLSSMLSRSLPAKLSASSFHGIPSVQYVVSLPSSEALPELFPRFPLRPARCLAPFQRSSPKAICTVSCPSSMLSRSLPAKLSPSYLHDFLSVQHAVSLPPSEALPSCFHGFLSVQHAVSLPPSEALASYLHCFLSVQRAVSVPPGEALRKLFPRFPLRPACCIAPSQRSSPQAIFARLPLRPACCLGPSRRSSPQAISTVSFPSSMLSRSLPAKLSANLGFPSVQHAVSLPPSEGSHGFLSVQHAVSLPPSEAFRKLFARFPIRPACCLAPS